MGIHHHAREGNTSPARAREGAQKSPIIELRDEWADWEAPCEKSWENDRQHRVTPCAPTFRLPTPPLLGADPWCKEVAIMWENIVIENKTLYRRDFGLLAILPAYIETLAVGQSRRIDCH